ncbi:MAG: hypothetical protein OEZ43_10875 [Gammaproteobacteria bacterium]|nr:hypothetical protein [Gammaproteobacteria bacterium]
MKSLSKFIIFLLFTTLMAACFHESLFEVKEEDKVDGSKVAVVNSEKFEESSTPVALSETDAKDAARASMKKALNDGVYALRDSVESMDAENSLSFALKAQTLRNKPAYKALSSPQMSRFLNGRFGQKMSKTFLNGRSLVGRTMHEEDELADAIDMLFDEILDAGVKDGNTVTYSLQDSVCDDISDEDDLAACEELQKHVFVDIVLNSDTSGVIKLRYDDYAPMAFGYSQDEWYYEVNLSVIKALAEQIQEDFDLSQDEIDALELPEKLSGSFRVTLALPAENKVRMAFGITNDIDVIFSDSSGSSSEKITFFVATAEVVSLTVDIEDTDSDLVIDLHRTEFSYAETNENKTESVKFAMAGVTGTFSGKIDGDTLVATNVGLRGQPVTFDINGQRAVTIEADTIDITAGESEDKFSITLDKALSAKVTVKNVNGEFAYEIFSNADNPRDPNLSASFSVTAPAGTVLADSQEEWMRVDEGGPFKLTVTGPDAGSVTVNQGECLIIPIDDSFPTAEECAAL